MWPVPGSPSVGMIENVVGQRPINYSGSLPLSKVFLPAACTLSVMMQMLGTYNNSK